MSISGNPEKDQILTWSVVNNVAGYYPFPLLNLLGIHDRQLQGVRNFGLPPLHFIEQRGPQQDGSTPLDIRLDPRTIQILVERLEDELYEMSDWPDDKTVATKLVKRAANLASRDGGHNKFLESMQVWLDITAPRYWWSQFDTYRVGITKQSESTMHTILKRPLYQSDFERRINPDTLIRLNTLIDLKQFDQLKVELPEGFLQRRIVCLNYKAIRHIVSQRRTHRLGEWQVFCEAMEELEHKEFLSEVQ